MLNKFKNSLYPQFYNNGRLYWPLLLLFISVNGLVLINTILHEPVVNYDSHGHWDNIEIYSQLRFPEESDSSEFFSPPLPYLLPAFLLGTGITNFWWATKIAQLANVFLSIGLTFYLVKLCDLIKPGSKTFQITSLGLLGLLPVYHKTFAFLRGECFVAFFAVFVAYQTLRIFGSLRNAVEGSVPRKLRNRLPLKNRVLGVSGELSSHKSSESRIFLESRISPRRIISLGVALGLGVLARQWMFLIAYPNPEKGDTIKATYMLQVFPFMAILAGSVLERVKSRSDLVYRILAVLLILIFIHNLPSMITRYHLPIISYLGTVIK